MQWGTKLGLSSLLHANKRGSNQGEPVVIHVFIMGRFVYHWSAKFLLQVIISQNTPRSTQVGLLQVQK